MKEMPNYYAIIPANVRYDKDLRANEKLMYGEITALANKSGESWASNQYFADLYQVTPQAVSKWINNLKEKGYISVDFLYKEESKEIDKRVIRIVSTNVSEVSTNDLGVSTNDLGGYQQKFKENNTRKNNIYMYIKEFCADDKELEEAFSDFLQMRKKIKKPITSERAIKMLINKLKELSADRNEWIDMLSEAVLHDWQSVYPTDKMKAKEPLKAKPKNKAMNFTQREESYTGVEQQVNNNDIEVSNETKAWFDDLFGDV